MMICFALIFFGYLYSNSYSIFSNANGQLLEKITIDLYETQFIPISDTTNNLDILVNYTTNDLSLVDSRINGIMEVFAPDGTQIKTSSFPDGFPITESGTIFMSSEFTDESLSSLMVNVTLTDLEKTMIISNTDSATVPFDDEEGQERLKDKFDRQIEEQLERQENGDGKNLVLLSQRYNNEEFGDRIVGEVLNNGTTRAEFVELTASFYDQNGALVGIESTYADPSTIEPGNKSPFEIFISSDAIENEAENYDFIIQWRDINGNDQSVRVLGDISQIESAEDDNDSDSDNN